MASNARAVNNYQKQQMRDQIQCQVEEFLKRGGEIHVMDDAGKRNNAKRASVWHGQEDIHQLID